MTVHSEVDFTLPSVVPWVFENFCLPDAQCDLSGAPRVCDSHVLHALVNVSHSSDVRPHGNHEFFLTEEKPKLPVTYRTADQRELPLTCLHVVEKAASSL